MEGLVSFTNDIAIAMAWVLPAACYAAAFYCFFTGVWGIWQQHQPQNPYVGKPWVPYLSVVLAGVFAAFDRILTKSATSANLDIDVSLSSASPTGYTGSVDPIAGTGPKDAILTIVSEFALFFQMFGAWVAFFAILAWHASNTGKTNRGKMSCFLQFAFGVVLLHPQKEATWLLSYWPT
ncbi:hypothetical protein [Kozakia baliensis]|uniref:Uncharacterized protein n=1 Tax=Kozakia baliensis TaxID=153496 RepID=A0A1D8UXT1_9PROT|nr:hypothetical protein [Kozakia baliensis]AOX18422.1 hypothetical protein A0U89_13975 [Kozakia baliensis]AOX21549.1 hypothetical protein A0U90_13710 [Kozakia baliensis]GBR34058.1 hypothetical protein AA0488_2812 [Kozakia baliensis NRIC 0488]GEL65138.1 hypothetical protein KBA01_24240 [Kozakia baliensis]